MTTRFLILGENGSGKELIAHLVHRCGKFADGPFVAVNCAALPAELVEAELFGHTAGAFTGAAKARKGRFQEANGGSIFLDEISEMPLDAQAKILRAVETMVISPVGSDKSFPVVCNIIAASNRDLERRVEESKFRQDLLYRLNVVQYRIPPLRERSDDIPLLAKYFLRRFADETKSPVKALTENSVAALCQYDFPGNTRELKNLMERVNIYCRDRYVELDELQTLLPQLLSSRSSDSAKLPLAESVAAYERDCIRAALTRNRGNVSRTARELGLERSHLYKKMKKLGIPPSGN